MTTQESNEELQQLFREHLRVHHGIRTEDDFGPKTIRAHLKGSESFIPATIFSRRLSPTETIVKYLRENEGFKNTDVAKMLGKTAASVWITYRNACAKVKERFEPEKQESRQTESHQAGGGQAGGGQAGDSQVGGGRAGDSQAGIYIPTEALKSGLSTLESLAVYLHEKGISYREVGRILARDERTIWTVCHRAKKKGVVITAAMMKDAMVKGGGTR